VAWHPVPSRYSHVFSLNEIGAADKTNPMQFPESWLRTFCNPALNTQELADLLTLSGMEVEALAPVAPAFSGVVVAKVLSVQPHPQADRLRICQVDIGQAAPLQIVCGAANVQAGIKVPCALVDARLPPAAQGGESLHIRVGNLRGVPSHGMLCAGRELGLLSLNEQAEGLLVLDASAVVGQSIRDHLQLDDTLFTLKLTPNLAHGLSLYGIAREVAALTGAPLQTPERAAVKPVHDAHLPVHVAAPDLCGRFAGRVIRQINCNAPTPAWMVERLARCGQRSVNALVDISNYVMLEWGQPSHVFDLNQIHGGLTVRWAKPGETLELLNGQAVELDQRVGVIADEKTVESLAGIMGGQATATSDQTRDVYVEAAFWWPEAVAGRSRRYQFSTEAGHRFERGVDPQQVVPCLERITQLILDICGGQPGPVDDQVISLPPCNPVKLRVARAAKVIGLTPEFLTQAKCEEVMQRLGLPFTSEPGVITVTPPSWRFDLQIEEDLIEEVIRVLGYASLPQTPPTAPLVARVRSEAQRSTHDLRHQMAALDYHETINYSFVDAQTQAQLSGGLASPPVDAYASSGPPWGQVRLGSGPATDLSAPIRVLNPIANNQSVMRTQLLGGLVQVLKLNLARKTDRVRVFEIGRVFKRDVRVVDGDLTVAGVDQPLRLAGLIYGTSEALQWGSPERKVDFFDAKGDVQALLSSHPSCFVPDEHPAMHPGRCARIELDGLALGHVGELHPRWCQAHDLPAAPMVFELDVAALLKRVMPKATPVARRQPVWRDIAVIAKSQGPDKISHAALMKAILLPAKTTADTAALKSVAGPLPRQTCSHGGPDDAQAATGGLAPSVAGPLPRQTCPHGGPDDAQAATGGLVDPRALLRSACLFDIYKPQQASTDIAADEQSLALRLEILDEDAALTDERIEQVTRSVLSALLPLGVRLRG
jgi:phenylalanyl-tRNA synthetase beta chain